MQRRGIMASKGTTLRILIVVLLGLAIAIALVASHAGSREKVQEFLYWMQQHLLLGATCFTVLYCIATGTIQLRATISLAPVEEAVRDSVGG